MPTAEADRAYTAFLKTTGTPDTPDTRAVFEAGFTARGDLDTAAVRQLKKGGWVLPERDEWFNFALADATRRISFIGGAVRRAIR